MVCKDFDERESKSQAGTATNLRSLNFHDHPTSADPSITNDGQHFVTVTFAGIVPRLKIIQTASYRFPLLALGISRKAHECIC